MHLEIILEILEGPLITIRLLSAPCFRDGLSPSFFVADPSGKIQVSGLEDPLVEIVVKGPPADGDLIGMDREDMRKRLPLLDQRGDQSVKLLQFIRSQVDAGTGLDELFLVKFLCVPGFIDPPRKRAILLFCTVIANIRRGVEAVTMEAHEIRAEESRIPMEAVFAFAGTMSDLTRIRTDADHVRPSKVTGFIAKTEAASIDLPGAGFFLIVSADLFGNGSRILTEHPSDLFKGTSLKEFLFNIGTV